MVIWLEIDVQSRGKTSIYRLSSVLNSFLGSDFNFERSEASLEHSLLDVMASEASLELELVASEASL